MNLPQTNNTIAELKHLAASQSLAGQFQEAVQTQIALINKISKQDQNYPQEMKLLGLYLFNLGDVASAISVMQRLLEISPNDAEACANLGVILNKAERYQEAIEVLEKSLTLVVESNTYDALASAYSKLGNREKAIEYGEKSLLLKDEIVTQKGKVYPIPQAHPLPFHYGNPAAHIIAFSLWGNKPRYLQGACQNAVLAPEIYPGWCCRFYCDQTVPIEVRNDLEKKGAEIVIMSAPKNFYDGLFWRFLVINDPQVSRYLIRDADSVINIKERIAVEEWLHSHRYFHIIRDYYSHTELILAGLWGGVGGVLPPLDNLLQDFRPRIAPTKSYDQLFLREVVWPTVRQSCLIHDSLFRVLDAKPFPDYASLPPDRHIGQNNWVFKKNEPELLISGASINAVVKGKHGYVTFNKNDIYIGKSIEKYGEFSELEVELFEQICQPGDLIVEVGANIGAHTIALAKIVGKTGRVYAYEPQRIVFQTLCANLAINSIDNVECLQVAICNENKHLVIPEIRYDLRSNFGGVELQKFDQGTKVLTAKLDDILQVSKLKLIKVDVEGMEYEVLSSAQSLINKYKPMLYVENERRDRSKQLIEFIHSLGYKAFWHRPPLFNPHNYAGNRENIFPGICSVNMLCIHSSVKMNIQGMSEVIDPNFHPLAKSQ